DPITTSRWVNNHTTPSPYRQLLVCLFFKTNLSKFIHRHLVDYASGTRGFKQNKKRIFNFVHSAIDKKISYLWSLKHQSAWYHEELSYQAYLDTIGEYRELTHPMPIDTPCQIVYKKSVNSPPHVTSFLHLTYLENGSPFKPDNNPCFISNMMHFHSETDFDVINQWLAHFFIKNDNPLSSYQLLLADEDIMSLYIDLGAKHLSSYYVDELDIRVHVLEIEVIRFLSSPYLIQLILKPITSILLL
ncbi:hypothetical protein L1D45_20400, partial [Photobacterium damselae]|nr:hypothetical protein [Photobacterium damselae]